MIAVQQLGANDRVFTEFIGVRVETALNWIRQCGFRGCHSPLRLTLRGRTWIESLDQPATRTT